MSMSTKVLNSLGINTETSSSKSMSIEHHKSGNERSVITAVLEEPF